MVAALNRNVTGAGPTSYRACILPKDFRCLLKAAIRSWRRSRFEPARETAFSTSWEPPRDIPFKLAHQNTFGFRSACLPECPPRFGYPRR